MTNSHLLAQGVDIRTTFFTFNPAAGNLARDPGSLISGLLPNIMVIAGAVLLVLIVYSGFHLISDAGSTNQQSIAKHKSMITVGIIGFLIVIASYFILQFILATLGVEKVMDVTL